MSELFESLVSLVRKPAGYADEKPFQAEFFSVERLEQYAQRSQLNTKPSPAKVALNYYPGSKTMAANSRALTSSCRSTARRPRNFPAAEWLVDNYHIVEEQLREIRQELPKATTTNYQNSPKVNSKAIRGSTQSRWS